jgi:hypothetical protein
MARWLRAARCRARTVCSGVGAAGSSGGASCASGGAAWSRGPGLVSPTRVPRPVRVSIISNSNEPTSASAGHALIRPCPMPCARLAPTVATIPVPRFHAASRGTGWFRRLAFSTTMDAAQISPSHRERQQPRRHPRLPVRAHQLERMLVGDDRGDDGHGRHRERRGDPTEPVRHSPSSSRQPMTNRSSSSYSAASRSARTMAVIA